MGRSLSDGRVKMGVSLRPTTMATATSSPRLSRRFIAPAARIASTARSLDSRALAKRDVFAEGVWPSIKVRLEMGGWSPFQIDQIHEQLRQGWTLPIAIRHVALRNGVCPLRSRPLG